jgi:talin
MVAAATHSLCEAAQGLVQGSSSEEKLVAAAKQVSAATAQLLVACKVKADPDSAAMKRLEVASNAVRRATDNLVKAAQDNIERMDDVQEETLNQSAVHVFAEEITARAKVLEMEKELENARKKLERLHQKKYKGTTTDSETEQSGYESSGYEYPPSQNSSYQYKTYTSHSSPFQQQSFTIQTQQKTNNDTSIESGPSFNESLERFKTASGTNNQVANWKKQQKYVSRTQNSQVTRSVEEQRTMITHSSQKSYHIE